MLVWVCVDVSKAICEKTETREIWKYKIKSLRTDVISVLILDILTKISYLWEKKEKKNLNDLEHYHIENYEGLFL